MIRHALRPRRSHALRRLLLLSLALALGAACQAPPQAPTREGSASSSVTAHAAAHGPRPGDAPAPAVEHVDEAGGFAILAPGAPRRDTLEVPIAGGQVITQHTVTFSASRPSEEWVVAHGDYPSELRARDPARRLDDSRDGILAELSATLSDEVDEEVDGYPSRRLGFTFAIDGAPFLGWARLVLRDQRLYQVMVVGDEAGLDQDAARRFVDAFRLLEPRGEPAPPTEHADEAGGFAITASGEPAVGTQRIELGDEGLELRTLTFEGPGAGEVTMVVHGVYPASYFVGVEAQEALRSARDGALSAAGATLIEEAPVTTSGHPGLVFRFSIADADSGDAAFEGWYHIVLDGERLFMAISAAPAEGFDAEAARARVDSLRLLP